MNLNPVEKTQKLKAIILALHHDENVDQARKEFRSHFAHISAEEIANIEQNLIDSGDLTAEQITKLCDLHVEIFKDAIDIPNRPDLVPGHPIHTYRKENAYARTLMAKIHQSPSPELIEELRQILLHYTRLENQLFPQLENKGFTGPSQVMWAKHDEIRNLWKSVDYSQPALIMKGIEDMIVKEEKILFPTALEKLSESDWKKVKQGEEEIGFAWITPGYQWSPITPDQVHAQQPSDTLTNTEAKRSLRDEMLKLSTGQVSLPLLDIMLKTLPLDISIIDQEDRVAYYSDVPDRIFPRSPGVIGRNVMNCHPPKSHHIVKKLLDAFKAGEKDVAEFWIPMEGKFIHIRYFALRNDQGKYLGTVEVTQNIADLQKLTGEQRLLDWEKKLDEKGEKKEKEEEKEEEKEKIILF